MSKLKLGAIADDKPVKLTVELPAAVHRDLLAYAEVLARETGQPVADPTKLGATMLARFMATDRAFAKARRKNQIDGEGQRSLSSFRKPANAGFSLSCRQYPEWPTRVGPVPSRTSLWVTPAKLAPREASIVKPMPKPAPTRLLMLSRLISCRTIFGRSAGEASLATTRS